MRRLRDMRGELEVIVRERPLFLEQHHDKPAPPAAHLVERHRQERLGARGRDLGPPVREALVLHEPRRGERPPFLGGQRERPQAGAAHEERPQLVPDLEAPGELEVARYLAQHCGAGRPERLGRGLRDGVERRGRRERLAEHGGDPIEAALDAGLPHALLERFGVAERDRREPRERVQQRQVVLGEAVVLERADAEHATHLTAGRDRRVHHLGEDGVMLARRRLLGRLEAAFQHRRVELDRLRERALGRDRAADLRLGQAENGAAAEPAAVLDDPAVGGVGADEA